MPISKGLFLLFLFGLTGCSLFYSAPPTIKGEPLAEVEQNRLIDQLLDNSAEVKSLRAVAKTKMVFRGNTDFFRQIIVFERPERIRLEYMPTHAIYTVSLLTANEREAVYIDVGEKKAWRGTEATNLMQKLIRVPITVSELTVMFAGRIPNEVLSAEQLTIYHDTNDNAYQIVSSDLNRMIILDAFSLQMRRIEVRSGGGRSLSMAVTYEEFQKIDNLFLPNKFKIEVPEHKFAMHLQLNVVSVNQTYPTSLYQALVPGNFSVEQVGS